MLKSSFKFAWRSISKYRTYSILNIGGLAIAITSFYLLFLYATDELSYDLFHSDHERIFRVTNSLKNGGMRTVMSGQPWGPNLVADHSEFEAYTRSSFHNNRVPIQKGEEIVFEDEILFVDSTFFRVFDYQLTEGSWESALDQPEDVVLTKSMALKYFGDQSPMGKDLRVNFYGDFKSFQVSGVMDDPPGNTHLTFNMLFTKQADFQLFPGLESDNWTRHNGFTYVKLAPGVTPEQGIALLPDFFARHAGESFNDRYVPGLQAITEIHLHSDFLGEIGPNGNYSFVKVAIFLSLFILLIGCINYINLNTALSVKRAKEVGARKVLGAYRFQLTLQFLLESVVVALCGVVVSVLLLFWALPYLNAISGKSLSLDILNDTFALLTIGILVGTLSGIYPATMLSRFKPTEVLKGKFQSSSKGLLLRRGLIIFQFTLSLVLLIGTGIIFDQSQYIRNKELGFDHQGVMGVNGAPTELLNEKLEVMRNNLTRFPEIEAIAATSSYPGNLGLTAGYKPEGFEGANEEMPVSRTIYADYEVVDILGFELLAGRQFNKNIASDSAAFMINESAAQLFGWDDPIGKTLSNFMPGLTAANKTGKVIGLVKDFHFQSLHTSIQPVVIHIQPNRHYNVLIKYHAQSFDKVLTMVEEEWRSHFPTEAFNHTILKDNFDQLHEADFQLQKIITTGAVLAILIACLGLFGLATFLAQQKVREIGIRKVLGATQLRLLLLLNKEFAVPILVSIGVGAPLSIYVMDQWLNDFAYRTNFNFWLVPTAALLVMIIALLTVSYKSLKASRENPVHALRQDG